MKTVFAAAAIAGATLLGAASAEAMPLAPLGEADGGAVIQVAQGCGPGWARNRYGECRPMRGYRAPVVVVPPRVVTPPVVVRPGCRPGFVWRHGRCYRAY